MLNVAIKSGKENLNEKRGLRKDKKLRQKLMENTKTRDYTNAEEIQKFYQVMEA